MTLLLERVSKQVGNETYIAPLDLELADGSLNVLLGLTLSGKTTLMRLMAGLDQPTTGTIRVNGQDVTRTPVRKRNVAMVYQQFVNYPSLTVYENIASPLRIKGLPRAEIDRRVRAEAERLKIDQFLDRLPAELSGGQQQRTAMARALVRSADLVLLDEPLVNLDYKLREALREELPNVIGDSRSIVVYATTDPWEAASLGGKVAVLEEGRLLQYAAAATVYTAPATTHVASISSDPPMNISPGDLEGGTLRLGGGYKGPRPATMSKLGNGHYVFGLRPEHTMIVPLNGSADQIRTVVDVTEVSGSDTYVHFSVLTQPWAAIEPGVHSHVLGEPVGLDFDPARLFVFDARGMLLLSPETSADQDNRVTGDGAHHV